MVHLHEQPSPMPADAHGNPDTHFKRYIGVFIALCILTAVSFGANQLLHATDPSLALWVILAVSCVKASLVGYIFMHLNFDWRRVYGIMVPVAIMAVMMMCVLINDVTLVYHLPELQLTEFLK